jgi:uncharacterized protein (TIGR02453 family)
MLNNDILFFLTELKQNNSKEWFDANRDRYQGLRKNFMDFLFSLIQALHEMDPSIGIPEPKECIFRINRDIRFSKDKTPYKTNFGAYISNGGRKSSYAGYYLNLEPKNCFAAGGLYMPDKDQLKAVREEINYQPEVFRKIIESPEFKKQFGSLSDDRLKTAPMGYDKNDPDIDLLRYKSFSVSAGVHDDLITEKKFISELISIFETLKPLNDFINRVLKG